LLTGGVGIATRSSGADARPLTPEFLTSRLDTLEDGEVAAGIDLPLVVATDIFPLTTDTARFLFSVAEGVIFPAADFRRFKLRDAILDVAASATFRNERRFFRDPSAPTPAPTSRKLWLDTTTLSEGGRLSTLMIVLRVALLAPILWEGEKVEEAEW
jgi:hypothetical protein